MAGLLGRLFRRRREEELRCSAVVPAAGSSTRMGQDKLLLPLGEQPVLLHTLRALELCPYITEIVVVTREELIVPIGQLCRDAALEKVRNVIVGGATRSHSVLVPVKDTVKRARDGLVTATLDRAELRAVQTPQVFQVDLIKTALQKALEDGAELTDDCAAVERLGIGVALTEGDYCNLKLTTPEDLAVAEALLAWREEQ